MKTRTKVIIGVVAAVGVAGAGTGIALSASAPEEATVLTESAQVRDVDVTVAASGTVDPALELGLQFSGFATAELATLEVEVGDVVAEGDALATLETEALEAAVDSARSGCGQCANCGTSGSPSVGDRRAGCGRRSTKLREHL